MNFNGNSTEYDASVSDLQQLNSAKARSKFDDWFIDLLDFKSSEGRALWAFIRRNLRVFRLHKTYSEAYVLNEAYVRGVKLISQGSEILNVTAWVRATAYNIIRELSRRQEESVAFEEEEVASKVDCTDIPSEDFEDDLAKLKVAFQMLSPSEQKLLNLKIAKGLSWEEIHETLRKEGDGDYTEAALRKRKERALTKLRHLFHTNQSSKLLT